MRSYGAETIALLVATGGIFFAATEEAEALCGDLDIVAPSESSNCFLLDGGVSENCIYLLGGKFLCATAWASVVAPTYTYDHNMYVYAGGGGSGDVPGRALGSGQLSGPWGPCTWTTLPGGCDGENDGTTIPAVKDQVVVETSETVACAVAASAVCIKAIAEDHGVMPW